ncbi:hypothetical protein DPEC_G00072250 [Dallia pectoralis]|uniref:Uncharacterized protein n=1 Tax=Dallia pectoralis TaxID=75939 RepID=A0ACC2H2P4_DALPE|nr:hypothetical protein DPEC_G00072250 [Dallia pectoralis]
MYRVTSWQAYKELLSTVCKWEKEYRALQTMTPASHLPLHQLQTRSQPRGDTDIKVVYWTIHPVHQSYSNMIAG